MQMPDFSKPAQRQDAPFARRDDGAMTALSLFLLTAAAMIGGFALDVANVMTQRTHLQITADSTAHAALVARNGLRPGDGQSESDAKDFALQLAAANMPGDRYGNILSADEIEFGIWDSDRNVPIAERFTPEANATSAVRVTTARLETLGNPIPTFLLRLVGLELWNVQTTSVFEIYQPACLREGFVAERRVDVQSNNVYLRGFCVHSNEYVSINQNNYFEPGTVVSMPDLDLFEMPNSGFERNEGLEAALREGSMDVRILNELDNIIAGLRNLAPEYVTQSYITSSLRNNITLTSNNNTLSMSNLVRGAVNDIHCTRSNGSITFSNSVPIEDVIIVTNCPISIQQGGLVQNAVLATTSTSATSITGASGTTFGADDDCAPGGGAQIITLGGMRFPASLGIFGSQLLARGNVEFAARADGIQGASIVAGGEIDGTSNSTMARCNTGMEGNFEVPYFRMTM